MASRCGRYSRACRSSGEASIPLKNDFPEAGAHQRVARGRQIGRIANRPDDDTIDLRISGLRYRVGAEPLLVENIRHCFGLLAAHGCHLEELLSYLWREAFTGGRARGFSARRRSGRRGPPLRTAKRLLGMRGVSGGSCVLIGISVLIGRRPAAARNHMRLTAGRRTSGRFLLRYRRRTRFSSASAPAYHITTVESDRKQQRNYKKNAEELLVTQQNLGFVALTCPQHFLLELY